MEKVTTVARLSKTANTGSGKMENKRVVWTLSPCPLQRLQAHRQVEHLPNMPTAGSVIRLVKWICSVASKLVLR